MKRIFILGCERSGSTWIANAMDAHAGVLFFMEPFADYIKIFPKIPTRNIYIGKPMDDHVKSVSSGFRKLKSMKYPLLYDIGRPLFLKKIDRAIFRSAEIFFRNLRIIDIPLWLQRYEALNLNTACISINQQVKKHKKVIVEVIKELRLNFKIRLLLQSFPEAFFLVTVRHPGAQISSIKRLFSKGTLGELKKNLNRFFKDICQNPRFKKYNQVIIRYIKSDQIDNKLILWWLINYEVLIEDLKKSKLLWWLVEHERISEDPVNEVQKIFNFCGLDFSEDVKKYIIRSSRRGNKPIISNLDTVRDSAGYYKRCIDSIAPELNKNICEILNWFYRNSGPTEVDLKDYLSLYYDL